jgi:TonB family protein
MPAKSGDSGAATAKGSGTGGTEGGGTGNGKGPNKGGKGTGIGNEYGWYLGVIRDRFYSTWQQPTSIVRSSQDFVTRLKIKIARDGTILARDIIQSSGNSVMDESVLSAAREVTQIDALPTGLGGESYEVNVDFKLDQDQ